MTGVDALRSRERRKAKAAAVRCPDEVRTELITVATGETRYWFLFDDATVETMASGILPEAVAQQCYMALEWKREQYRVEAHRKAEIAPLCVSEATT